MFQAIFRRAQDAVENSIENSIENSLELVVTRVAVAVPFVLAAIFATAALSSYLTREYGSELANLALAGIFAAIGLLAAAYTSFRSGSVTEGADEPQADSAAEQPAEQQDARSSMSGVDSELLTSALSAVGPLAIPRLLRLALRNIPALIAAAVFIYLISQRATGLEPSEQPVPAGE